MQPGPLGGVAAPHWVHLVPLLPPAVDADGVPRLQGSPLGRRHVLKLPAVDGLFLGDEGLAAEPGHVQQDAAGDDALLPVLDGPPGRALEGDDVVGIAAVPHAVFIPHVAEGVEVGVGLAVVGHAVVVGGQPAAGLAHAPVHEVLGRRGIVGRGGLGELAAEGHGPPLLHQPRGRQPLLVGDHVHRADLVVGAPASPVAVFFKVGEDFILGGHSPFHRCPPAVLRVAAPVRKSRFRRAKLTAGRLSDGGRFW